MRLATMAFTISSLTRPPCAMMEDASLPNSVPAWRSARNISPVEMAGMWKRSARKTACVPLPHPGGPKSKRIKITSANLQANGWRWTASMVINWLRFAIFRMDSAVRMQAQLPIPPLDRMAEQSGQPDRESEQIAQRHEPEIPGYATVMENARAYHHPSHHAQPQRQRRGPPVPGGQGHQGPHGGVRHRISEIARRARNADGARPPQLVPPRLRPRLPAQAGLNHHRRELDAIAQPADVPPKLVIVCQVIGEGFEAAHLAQGLRAKHHGGTKRELGLAQEARHQHAGRELGRDSQGLHARRPRIRRAAIEASHQAD